MKRLRVFIQKSSGLWNALGYGQVEGGVAAQTTQALTLIKQVPRTLVERFDIEPFSDFSAI